MVAYLGENHSVCRGCSLRTMVLLIMLSPSSLVMAVRVVHLCPGFLLLSRTIYICSLPQFSSVSQSCPTLCDPMNHSTPGLPVHNQLPEFTQTHVHRLLLGRKVMTNLDIILKSRDITLPTKVRLVKAMVFPVVMYGCESWIVKKAER